MTTLFGYDHNKLLDRDIKDTEATTHVQSSPETLEAVLSKWKITAGVYGFTSSLHVVDHWDAISSVIAM
jgi:hypothetical protein